MKKGFTLVEIMIVVAIIALLAAISIPNLMRARLTANEGAAASALHTIAAAQIQWRSTNPAYAANLGILSGANPPYIDATLGSGDKQGYDFTTSVLAPGFIAEAVSQGNGHSFYIDDAGVLCRSTAVAVAVLGAHQGGVCPATHPEMQ